MATPNESAPHTAAPARHLLGLRHVLGIIGPGLLITVGSIDPGNWATNMEAGSTYGYTLLSVQLPITVACLLFLTSSGKVMAEHRSHGIEAALLYLVGAVIVVLNIMLIVQSV